MAEATRRSSRFSTRSKQLGQLLAESGEVQAEQVAQALKVQEQQGGLLGAILCQQGVCEQGSIAQALLKQVQVTDVRCEELSVDPEVAALISPEMCETEKLCPFERIGNLLCIVMGNPLNRRAITQIEAQTGLKVKSFKCVWPKIHDLIQRTYQEGVAAPAEPAPPLEIPVNEPAVTSKPSAPQRKPVRAPEAQSQPAVAGMDTLDESNAEVIEVNRRGLRRTDSAPVAAEAPKPKQDKRAKVNVDLDTLDLSEGEVVQNSAEDEGLVEIATAAPLINRPLVRHAGQIVALQAVDDGYFYAEGQAPGTRSGELDDLIDALPLAQTVAQSIGEYESAQSKPASSRPAVRTASASRAIELQPAPEGAMPAASISEQEFQRLKAGLDADPVGEWDWQFAAAGPVTVLEYEEV